MPADLWLGMHPRQARHARKCLISRGLVRLLSADELAALRRADGKAPLLSPERVAAHVADELAELTVDALVLTRNLAAGPNLAGEVRRNLAVHAGGAGQQPVQALYLAGGEHLHLRERLQDMLGIPVHVLDPFGGSEQPDLPATGRGGFVGPVGLLHAQAERRGLPVPVDAAGRLRGRALARTSPSPVHRVRSGDHEGARSPPEVPCLLRRLRHRVRARAGRPARRVPHLPDGPSGDHREGPTYRQSKDCHAA